MDPIHSSTTREGRRLRGMVGGGYEIYPSCHAQRNFVVDRAHHVVDLEARKAVVLNAALPDTASLFDTI
jgi:hypothetical protein